MTRRVETRSWPADCLHTIMFMVCSCISKHESHAMPALRPLPASPIRRSGSSPTPSMWMARATAALSVHTETTQSTKVAHDSKSFGRCSAGRSCTSQARACIPWCEIPESPSTCSYHHARHSGLPSLSSISSSCVCRTRCSGTYRIRNSELFSSGVASHRVDQPLNLVAHIVQSKLRRDSKA